MASERDAERLIAELRDEIRDPRVLEAIASAPRELFVGGGGTAYRNKALPIACGQTISQPLVVARMTALLRLGPSDRVLDVGTGSGWHAAVLARLAGHVWTIERHPELAAGARRALEAAGLADRVTILVGDGTLGWPGDAPYDAINVAAATDEIPSALTEQLAPGGRLVAPIGGPDGQRIVLLRREEHGFERHDLDPVRFVPLIPGLPGA